MIVGVLALQGDFFEHRVMLETLGVEAREVRLPRDLEGVSGLIIPGGESTTISKLLKMYNLDTTIKKKVKQGMGIWGTCAGAILLSKQIIGDKIQPLGLIDISIQRNAYGRQIDSFEGPVSLKGKRNSFSGVFIRAPLISRVGKSVEVLGTCERKPVFVQQGNVMVTTFHPELNEDTTLHQHFLTKIKKKK